MYNESDSDSYAPSWAGSDYTPPVARTRRRKQNQKMLVEVVIPIPNSSKRKGSSPAWSPRNQSPTRSESSISLGTNWHRSPQKKRRRQRKSTGTVTEESTLPRRKRGRPRKQAGDGPTPSVRFQPPEPTATSRPRPSTITVDLASARLDNIQAQERSRGYQHLFTPPSSGDTRSPDLKDRVARGSPLSRTGSRLYALEAGQAGSSTGPGTQEWAQARGTATISRNEFPISQRETRSSALAAASSQVPGYRSTFSQPRDRSATPRKEHTMTGSPVKREDLGRLPQVAFADPDYDLWAQIGLRVTFERMVEEYGFSMDMVERVYGSRGSVEDTEQFLIKMKNMMTDAMHNPEM